MLEEKDLQAIAQMMSAMEGRLDEKLNAMETRMDERTDEKLSSMETRMDEKLSSMETRMDKRMDEKLNAMETRTDEKLRAMEARTDEKLNAMEGRLDEKLVQQRKGLMQDVTTLMDAQFGRRFDLLAEGQDIILQKLEQHLEDMDIMDTRLTALEAMVKKLNREVTQLKKAN